ncbi:MAG TPA: ABC transporter substrate-binding protein [Burkholderiales bacterium]|nr:ABC transporter substrate-binding protein [Burkholderiales bacterium]
MKCALYLAVAVLLVGQCNPSWADTSEVRIARQIGLGFLQLMVMEDEKLIEKHAKAAGLENVKVSWSVFNNASAMNDALISDKLDFATAGIPAILTLWSRTRGTPHEVDGVVGVNVTPLLLNTRNPNVHSIRDFSDGDKIGLTGVKVALQAIVLQMAAAKVWGEANYSKLDHLTVTMSHPDAMAAMLSGKSEVNSHFASPPFQYLELEQPGIHTVLDSNDIVGRMNFSVVFAKRQFYETNPKLCGAVVGAFREATETIQHDMKKAAELYLRMSRSKDTIEHTLEIMRHMEFTMTPHGFTKFAEFMSKVGTLKNTPKSWREVFLPTVHGLPGD